MWSILLLSLLGSPLNDLQKTFAPYEGFQTRFEQSIEQEIFSKDENQASGQLIYKKPSVLRWEYKEPKEKTIELKNRTLVIKEDGKAEVASGSNRINLEEAFSFLWGETDSTQFETQTLSANQFQLTPKVLDHVTFKSILVTTERREDGKVVVAKAEVNGKLGDTSILRFSNWRFSEK